MKQFGMVGIVYAISRQEGGDVIISELKTDPVIGGSVSFVHQGPNV